MENALDALGYFGGKLLTSIFGDSFLMGFAALVVLVVIFAWLRLPFEVLVLTEVIAAFLLLYAGLLPPAFIWVVILAVAAILLGALLKFYRGGW